MVRLQRLANKYYRELFESASEAIWIHDLEGNIIAANKAAERLSGYSLEEQFDLKVGEFLDEEGLARAKLVRQRLLGGELVEKRYEQRIRTRAGTEAILELGTSLIVDKGRPVAFQHIARDVTEERRMQESLRRHLQAVLRAQENERNRIARELHDEPVQSLLLLSRRLESIVSDSGGKLGKSVTERLEEMRGLVIKICEDLWRYAHDLRPRILDDMGLVAALEYLADQTRQNSATEVSVQVIGRAPDLSGEAQLVMFRIVQEALNNIRKCAEASNVVVRLEFEEDRIALAILDDGRGFAVPSHLGDLTRFGRLGIRGMYERARLLGGTFDIRSAPGEGTAVLVELPCGPGVTEPAMPDSTSETGCLDTLARTDRPSG